MINGIKPKTLQCSRCSDEMPSQRLDMGYTICIKCSTEEKVSCHTIYPHKTGGYIQVVSKEQSQRLNRLDRRGSSQKTAKNYKPFTIQPTDEPKQYNHRKCTKTYTTYETALQMVNQYYDEWGYKPTLKYLRKLNSSGDIPLMTRVKIQDIITDRYLEPSPRALTRHFNNRRK
tara:strand:+ start:775 stop:1293 length:519 start_codon:yes stop_codon:yes gene_type:complete